MRPPTILLDAAAGGLPAWAQIALALAAAGGLASKALDWLRDRTRLAAAAAKREQELAAATAKGEQDAATQIRKELFEIVNRQQAEIDALKAEIKATRVERHELVNENNALKLRCHLLEREVVELKQRLGAEEAHRAMD